MIYIWDNGEPGYDGHDVLIVESDAPVEDVLALLSRKGQVVAMAEVALANDRLSLAQWWRERADAHHRNWGDDDRCAAWKGPDGGRWDVVHTDCNCGTRPLIDAAIKLGLMPAKETP